jgi:sugar lactone lactonase YvrE
MMRKILLSAMFLLTGAVLINSCRKAEISNLPGKQASSLATANLFQGFSGDGFARTPIVSTIAGNDNAGMIDGIGTEAEFNVPRNLVVDPAGNIFVTDQFNRRIRKITPVGVVTTLVGAIDGPETVISGSLSTARLCDPVGIAMDAAGTMYVTEIGSHGVRRIADGFVSSIAGNGSIHAPFPTGLVDATGSNARFNTPWGAAVDAAGNVYVADLQNNRIREIFAGTTSVTTYAGSGTGGGFADGPANTARFSGVTGVAADAAGNVYVADAFNNRIRKISSNRMVTTLAGNGTAGFADGQGANAQFNDPEGLTVDAAGNVYVADGGNRRIRKISSGGIVTTLAGNGTQGHVDGSAPGAEFIYPQGIALDGTGNLYVVDNHRIRKITITPTIGTSSLAGNGIAGNTNATGTFAQFNLPAGIAVDVAGNVYVADQGNDQIRKITSSGVVTLLAGSRAGFGDGTSTIARFNTPTGIAVDQSGNVYVADQINHRIRKITSSGVVSTLAGNGTRGFADGQGSAAQFNYPVGVATDASGNVYVADANNNRIRKITPDGTVSTLAGSGLTGFADGTATVAKFSSPFALTVDASGNIYVADKRNNRIRKIIADGTVSTLAGSIAGFADGIGTAALFSGPLGIASDASGNIYVADAGNNRIRKITPTGVVSTLQGTGTAGYVDGSPAIAAFNAPFGIAIDINGTLYIGDQNNHAIRMITQ